MFCGQCGKQNPDNSRFCYQCGATLFHPEAQNPVAPPTPVQQPTPTAAPAQPVVQTAAPSYQPPLPNPYAYTQASHAAQKPATAKPSEEDYQTRKKTLQAQLESSYKIQVGSVLNSPVMLILALFMSYVCVFKNLSQLGDLFDLLPLVENFESTCVVLAAFFQIAASVLYCVGLWITYGCSFNRDALCTNPVLITGLQCIKFGLYAMITSSILSFLGIMLSIVEIVLVIDSLIKYLLVIIVFLVMLIIERACISGVVSSLIANLPTASPDAAPAKSLMTFSGIITACYVLLIIDAKSFLGPFSLAFIGNKEALFLNAGMFLLVCILAFLYHKVSTDLEAESADMYRQLANIQRAPTTAQAGGYSSYPGKERIPSWKLAEMQKNQQNPQ